MDIYIKKLLRIITYIIIFDVILFGAGKMISVGSISLRMMLYVAAFLLMLIYMFAKGFNVKDLKLSNIHVKLILIFLVYVVFAAVNGYYFQHHALGYVISDVTGFMTLFIIFLFNITIQDEYEIKRIAAFIAFAVTIQSVMLLSMHYLLSTGVLSFNGVNYVLQNYYLGFLSYVAPHTVRIFLKSSIYLQIGFTILLVIITEEKNKKHLVLEYFCLVLILYATILTFTRGFWVGVAIAFIILLSTTKVKNIMRTIVILIIGVSIMLGLSIAAKGNLNVVASIISRTDLVKPAVLMELFHYKETPEIYTDQNQEGQDLTLQYRDNLTHYMLKNIEKHPVIGNGFGVIISELKQTASKCEFMYLDIIMEMGIIGFALFAMIILVLYKKWIEIRKTNKGNPTLPYINAFMASLAGVLFTSALNPFLNNPIGLTYLVFVISAVNVYIKDEANKE